MRLASGVRSLSIPVMVVAVALLACKKKKAPPPTTRSPLPIPTKTAPVLPETPKGKLKLKQAAKLDGVTLTVEEFKDCRLSNFYSRRSLKRKKEKLIGVNVIFEGNGEKDHNVSYTQFKVKDPEGMTFRSIIRSGSDCNPTLKSGRVGQGEKTRGWVLFSVPQTVENVEVVFTNRRPYRTGTPSSEREQKVTFDPSS